MTEQPARVTGEARRGRRMARRIFKAEAYRRIAAGNAPETLSEFAAQLAAWFQDTYPAAPAASPNFIEAAVRDIWHRRHVTIGSEL